MIEDTQYIAALARTGYVVDTVQTSSGRQALVSAVSADRLYVTFTWVLSVKPIPVVVSGRLVNVDERSRVLCLLSVEDGFRQAQLLLPFDEWPLGIMETALVRMKALAQ